VDIDTLLAAVQQENGMDTGVGPTSSSSSTQVDKQQQQRRQQVLLQQQLQCGGQQLPAAATEAVLQGGIAKSLLLLQRTPQLACQLLLQGERLLYALPLMLFSGEPVRLVLLLELFSAPAAAGTVDVDGSHQQQQQQQQGGLMYCSVGVVPFVSVYPAIRALGPCDWVSWVKEAVAALQQE
jgi:hypothetical protein